MSTRNPTPLALSPSERRALVYAAKGLSAKGAADLDDISFWTVKDKRASIVIKLRAVNMTHAVAIAFAAGLLTREDLA